MNVINIKCTGDNLKCNLKKKKKMFFVWQTILCSFVGVKLTADNAFTLYAQATLTCYFLLKIS